MFLNVHKNQKISQKNHSDVGSDVERSSEMVTVQVHGSMADRLRAIEPALVAHELEAKRKGANVRETRFRTLLVVWWGRGWGVRLGRGAGASCWRVHVFPRFLLQVHETQGR